MAKNSSIEWTECTWNPVTGCSKISSGCKNCYAQRMALRLQAMGQPNYRNGFHLTLHPHMLEVPLRCLGRHAHRSTSGGINTCLNYRRFEA